MTIYITGLIESGMLASVELQVHGSLAGAQAAWDALNAKYVPSDPPDAGFGPLTEAVSSRSAHLNADSCIFFRREPVRF